MINYEAIGRKYAMLEKEFELAKKWPSMPLSLDEITMKITGFLTELEFCNVIVHRDTNDIITVYGDDEIKFTAKIR